jgi:hypothetical protein
LPFPHIEIWFSIPASVVKRNQESRHKADADTQKEEPRECEDRAVFERGATKPRRVVTAHAFEKKDDDTEMNRISPNQSEYFPSAM